MPTRKFPIGAELLPGGGVHFRVWAPDRKKVEVVLDPLENRPWDSAKLFDLDPEDDGYFSGTVTSAGDGTIYKYRLDEDENDAFPDPASKFQPEGPHKGSQVIDLSRFQWTDQSWQGVKIRGQIIYEMHIGTFSPEATWEGARRRLPHLVDLGVTVVEVMPVADFSGRFGWGYDGVNLFAPTRLYGCPQAFQRFVNDAHALGLGVILDVVYNHLGPSGNYLRRFSKDYFSVKHITEWGDAINYDGARSSGVREFFLTNAAYWIAEFHLDGLRLDATQAIIDSSPTHLLQEVVTTVRSAAGSKDTIIVGENEPQESVMIRPREKGGYGLDALWNDDFHHSAAVALTGRREAYYSDYHGHSQEFISTVKWGFLFQGQRHRWQMDRRGTASLGLPPTSWINFIENHDQVANSARGQRLHQITSPGRLRAMTALLMLAPGTPMLFQGQEFASSKPFLYFADHDVELSHAVFKGRREFLHQFRSFTDPRLNECFADPSALSTYEASKLDFSEVKSHAANYALHKDLIALRKSDPAFSMQEIYKVDGAVLSDHAFVLRYFLDNDNDRLFLVNFGGDLDLYISPEPFLAPPTAKRWHVAWSSEDPKYGGCGALNPDSNTDDNWRIQGECAIALVPMASSDVYKPTHIEGPKAKVERKN